MRHEAVFGKTRFPYYAPKNPAALSPSVAHVNLLLRAYTEKQPAALRAPPLDHPRRIGRNKENYVSE